MKNRDEKRMMDCRTVHDQLQDYVDGSLARRESMELFLHCRDCADCRRALEATEQFFDMLGELPAIVAPADFDERILASVPYEAYRAMEPLRRERVPVLLAEESLPAFVRSDVTRTVGALLAVVGLGSLTTEFLPGWTTALMVGIVPAALVGLQSLSRRIYVGMAAKSTAR